MSLAAEQRGVIVPYSGMLARVRARLRGRSPAETPEDASGGAAFRSAPRARRAEFLALARESADGPLRPARTTRWLADWYQGEPLALLAAGALARSLRREGRVAELLALHAALPDPSAPAGAELTRAVHTVAREVLLLPAPPPRPVSLAVSRVDCLLSRTAFRPGDPDWTREAVLCTLALGQLRQGQFATAELLCQPALAHRGLPDPQRATALATVVLARRALGLPYQAELDEALILCPGADLVPEASVGDGPAGDERAGRAADGARA